MPFPLCCLGKAQPFSFPPLPPAADVSWLCHCAFVLPGSSSALLPRAPIPCLARSLSPWLQEPQQHPLGPSSAAFSLSHQVCGFDLRQGSFLCSPWSPLLLSWTDLGNECSSSCLNSCADCSLVVLRGLLPSFLLLHFYTGLKPEFQQNCANQTSLWFALVHKAPLHLASC